MLQLNPPIPMNTPKGEGFAHILIDYGPESDLYWTVLITATGEIWTYANRYVRASKKTSPWAGPTRLSRLHPAAWWCPCGQALASLVGLGEPLPGHRSRNRQKEGDSGCAGRGMAGVGPMKNERQEATCVSLPAGLQSRRR